MMKNFYSIHNQLILRPYIQYLKVLNTKKFSDFSKSVFISGSPRGGTTWLEEIIQKSLRSLYIHEPLFIGRIGGLKKIGFGWTQFIPEDYLDLELRLFFKKLLSGKILNPALIEKNLNIYNIHQAEYLLIKSVRSGLLLPWLANIFELKIRPIHIVRHPCAVISSQLQHASWSNLNTIRFPIKYKNTNKLFEDFWKPIEYTFQNISSVEELLAINWCLDQFPLYVNNTGYVVTFYEDLVTNGNSNLKILFNLSGLNIDINEKYIFESSSSVTIGKPVLKGVPQLEKWKAFLSSSKIDKIQNVLDKFGVKHYHVSELFPTDRSITDLNSHSLYSECISKSISF